MRSDIPGHISVLSIALIRIEEDIVDLEPKDLCNLERQLERRGVLGGLDSTAGKFGQLLLGHLAILEAQLSNLVGEGGLYHAISPHDVSVQCADLYLYTVYKIFYIRSRIFYSEKLVMSKVIVPGEIETSNDVQRRNEGVPIRDEDWQGVMDVAIRLGVASEN